MEEKNKLYRLLLKLTVRLATIISLSVSFIIRGYFSVIEWCGWGEKKKNFTRGGYFTRFSAMEKY